MQLLVIRRRLWADFCFRETRRLRVGVGIKNRHGHCGVSWPKANTAHFLRVGFARDRVRQMRDPARMWRRGTSRKTRDRQIKTAPEKMHGTAFAAKTRTEFFKDTIGLREDTPKSVRIFRIVRSVLLVAVERNRLLNLVR